MGTTATAGAVTGTGTTGVGTATATGTGSGGGSNSNTNINQITVNASGPLVRVGYVVFAVFAGVITYFAVL